MKLNFSKYSKTIKRLSIIPFLFGVFTLLDLMLPSDNFDSIVISKTSNYRAKHDRTTYTINFENIFDQFTEELYNSVEKGDSVRLKTTHFHERIEELTIHNKTFLNSNGEVYFMFGFAFFYFIPSLSWLKKRSLSNFQSKFLSFIIVFATFSLLIKLIILI